MALIHFVGILSLFAMVGCDTLSKYHSQQWTTDNEYAAPSFTAKSKVLEVRGDLTSVGRKVTLQLTTTNTSNRNLIVDPRNVSIVDLDSEKPFKAMVITSHDPLAYPLHLAPEQSVDVWLEYKIVQSSPAKKVKITLQLGSDAETFPDQELLLIKDVN